MPVEKSSEKNLGRYIRKPVRLAQPNIDIGVLERREFKSPEERDKALRMIFHEPVQAVPGVGPKTIKKLAQMGIKTRGDLYYEIRYGKLKKPELWDFFPPQLKKEARAVQLTQNRVFISNLKYYHDHKPKARPRRVIKQKGLLEQLLGIFGIQV